MPQEAAELLTREHLYDAEPLFDWDYSRREIDGMPGAAAPSHRPGEGLGLGGPGGVSDLEWPVELDAAELDALHVTLAYPQGADATLFWRRTGESFEPSRSLRQRRGDGIAGRDRTLTFELLSHARWQGRISALRLRFALVQDESRTLRRLRGLDYRLSPEALAEGSQHPWKVDLDHQARTAILAPPGVPIERQIDLPQGGVLRFAYGAAFGPAKGVGYRITSIQAGGAPEVLFEASLENELPRWREGVVELPAGGPGQLTFETSSSPESQAIPVWGNLEVVSAGPRDRRPNVILISVDTLRPDHLSMYGYAAATSPRLDAWARRHGVIFSDAVAQAPWTLPSHVSMFTGLDAARHGVNFAHTVVPSFRVMLAEGLREAGYSTAAVTGGGFLHPKYGFAQGFERFCYWPALGEPENELETAVERSLGWLESLPRPFFLFLHTFDVHDYAVYRRSAGAGEATGGDAGVDWYDRRIRHTDEQLGRLLERLGELGLRGETAVILTSDHGEGFGGRDRGHGHLSESNLRVPLVIEVPDGRGACRAIARQVRSVDVPATILDLAGLDPWSDVDGVSLLPLIAGEPSAVPDLAASYAASRRQGLALRVGGRWKYVLPNSAWGPSGERMYDLEKDPEESLDLAAGHPRRETLRRQALRMLDGVPGYHLRFANATPRPLYFRLRGRMLGEATVTATAMPCPCVRREQPYQALIEVPPRERFDVHLEEVVDDPLAVQAWSGGVSDAAELSETLRLAPADTPWTVSLEGGRWRLGRAGPPAESGMTVSWKTGLAPAAGAPSAADPDLRRRLRALGYLD